MFIKERGLAKGTPTFTISIVFFSRMILILLKRRALIDLPTFTAFRGLPFYMCSWCLVKEEVLQMAFTTLVVALPYELSDIYLLTGWLID